MEEPDGSALDYGGAFTAPGLLLSGLAVQIALLIVRIAIRRHVADPAMAAQGLRVLELVGDGATVLLFAVGTLGAILRAPAAM